jgi:Spy/CpxP family protein refolding chaperone
MRHKKAFIVITALLALSLLLSACAQTAETPGGPPAAVAPDTHQGTEHRTRTPTQDRGRPF